MRRPRTAWVAAAAAAAALSSAVAVGCDSDDATENQQEAVKNALTSDPTATTDRPGTPTTGEATTAATTDEGSGAGGSVDASPRDGSGSEVTIPAAEDGLRFTRTSVTATAGTITLKMANPSENQHNIAVDKPRKAAGEVVGKGGVSTITVDFPAGRYRFYCSVDGHADAGMVGTLIVE